MQGSFIWDDISKAIPREPWQKWKQKKNPEQSNVQNQVVHNII